MIEVIFNYYRSLFFAMTRRELELFKLELLVIHLKIGTIMLHFFFYSSDAFA